ncbi:hypothetical protein HPP92_018551 [Vanilla planifolia]|uniref:chorismate mutase n=1 Tax=Vanilla planifolia TaxID=51239 RepID=A0A835Q5Y0_VANPL|nr:hypothetical protein HPP92_018551 [Vanilla planifolia]
MASSIPNYFHIFFLCSLISLLFSCLGYCRPLNDAPMESFTLDSLRASLEGQEDVILLCLIERATFANNSPTYDPSYLGVQNLSIVELFIRQTEAMEAKFGRYQNPEELPFFPNSSPIQMVPPHKFPQILYPPAASVNVSKVIWDAYFNELLPMFIKDGDDGNYQQTAAADLSCLQALSKRIHYGRFVGEVKFSEDPQNFSHAIQAKDIQTLMNMVTFASLEEAVVKRVFKKAEVFGQNVTLEQQDAEKDLFSSHLIHYMSKRWKSSY